jgi:hypothetical protein
MPKVLALPSNRSFGVTFAVIFGLIAIWQGWTGRLLVSAIFATLGMVTLLVAHKWPSILSPLNHAWAAFGALIHAIVNPVVLGAIYFIVITPVGVVMRLFGRDALMRKADRAAGSYWIERNPPGPAPDSLPHQF